MSNHSDVHVIGGGLGGLATAALVARAGHTVTVHESRGRLGGRATTDEHNGFRFNQGPHALYVGGEGARVLAELGIRPSGSPPPVRGTQMVVAGERHLAPVGPLSLLRTGLLRGREKVAVARLLARLPRLDPASLSTVTVDDWVDSLTDHGRVREILYTLVRLATYTNAGAHLSAEIAVLQLQLALDDGVIYLDRGWEQLVHGLSTHEGVTVQTGERLTELPDAPAVVIAAGGPDAAASLIGHGFGPSLAAEVAVLDLGLGRPAAFDVVLGVDRPFYLSNHGFPVDMVPEGRSSVSIAQYLAPGDEPRRDELVAFAAHAGIAPGHVVDERYLHRMVAVTALATAQAGGLAGRAPVAVPDCGGVFVVGDWVGPRGHLVDAVLASAEEAAAAVVAHLARRPVLR